MADGQQLLDPALCVYWTPHSPRSFMATCCAALGVAKAERNVLGRWAQNQSDTYVRLQRTLVQKLQLLVVSVLRGRDDIGSVLGEGESLQELLVHLCSTCSTRTQQCTFTLHVCPQPSSGFLLCGSCEARKVLPLSFHCRRRYNVFVTDDSQSYLPLFAFSEEAQTTCCPDGELMFDGCGFRGTW